MAKPETSLSVLNDTFRPVAERILTDATAAGLDPVVIFTLRTQAEQMALYAKGRAERDGKWVVVDKSAVVTNASVGKSPHEYGLALDVCPRVLMARKAWDPSSGLWVTFGRIVEACGAEWGGRFPSPDRPHAQAKNWKALR